MCTAITLNTASGSSFLGRNMDFSHKLEPHFYFVPKNYRWKNIITSKMETNPYSFIAAGQQMDHVLAFFDGVNEHGLAAAVLYFAGYAKYSQDIGDVNTEKLASYDFLHYLLGNYTSVNDFTEQVNNINIIGMEDPLTKTVAPLHWIVADKTGKCIVVERTQSGMHIYDNKIGVLSNSPGFPWHMTNLRNYMETSPYQKEESVWGEVALNPFGQGGGTTSLPGGYTPPERFVRAAYLKTHVPQPSTARDALISFFQIMKSVSIPKGAVITARGTDDYTQYTSFIDISSQKYYFNTYENLQIKEVGFPVWQPNSSSVLDLGAMIQPMTWDRLSR